MTSIGFPSAATEFFAALEDDNSREHFAAQRDVFDRAVKEPMAALLAALPPRYGTFHVFRIHRDVRFSADKSPYKLQHGAVHEDRGGVRYLHLDADGLLCATGAYVFSPDQLERFRAAVDDPGSAAALRRALNAVQKYLEVGPGGSAPLTTAPRGYRRDHPRIELLRQKGLIASDRLGGSALRDGDRVLAFVLATFEAGAPLNRWLTKHVGEAEHRPEPGRGH
ncbi:MAG: TIGR02453 family protein [Propionibacteriaceae bacterium]